MSRAYGGIALACCLGLLIASATPVPAQPAVQHGTYTKADRGECNGYAPRYPLSELMKWTEGWVDMRMTVTAEGKIQDIVVINQMGKGRFDDNAILWLQNCTFKPATRNGTPVETRNFPFRFFYIVNRDNHERGASPAIARRLRTVDDLLEAGQADKALVALEDIGNDSQRIYEMVHVLARRGLAISQMGQPDMALLYLQKLQYSEHYLPPKEQGWMRRLALRLSLMQGLYLDARDIAGRITNLGSQEGDDQLKAALAELEALGKSGVALAVGGRVPIECRPEICTNGKPVWRYRPVRRTISLADIQGELEAVEVLCDTRTFQAKPQAGITWKIPASWGECTMEISGKPGATFRVVDENT